MQLEQYHAMVQINVFQELNGVIPVLIAVMEVTRQRARVKLVSAAIKFVMDTLIARWVATRLDALVVINFRIHVTQMLMSMRLQSIPVSGNVIR